LCVESLDNGATIDFNIIHACFFFLLEYPSHFGILIVKCGRFFSIKMAVLCHLKTEEGVYESTPSSGLLGGKRKCARKPGGF
jgi:hypothetical protein